MDVVFHLREGAEHQFEHAVLLEQAIKADGNNVRYGQHNVATDAELAIIWSWKQPALTKNYAANNVPVLVMERGFIPKRMDWCSLSLNGFNGKGKWTSATDNGERFKNNFSHLLKPWKQRKGGYALLFGQVPNDPSMHGVNHYEWLQEQTNELISRGYKVVYRPHPYMVEQGSELFIPAGAELSRNVDLFIDLNTCRFAVMFNSNSAVESVLYGVPTMTFSEGSVAYDVTSHDYDNPIFTPDRKKWYSDLAFRQWSKEELQDGTAWNYIKKNL